MMTYGLVTFVVALVVGALLIIGAVILNWSARPATGGAVCRACGHENQADARYCGRCGKALR